MALAQGVGMHPSTMLTREAAALHRPWREGLAALAWFLFCFCGALLASTDLQAVLTHGAEPGSRAVPAAIAAAAAAAAAPAPAPASASASAPAASGLSSRCDETVVRSTIARRQLETWLPSPTVAATPLHRLVPTFVGGKPAGFKVYALRPMSPLALAGFENGDRVHRVQGVELDRADTLFEATRRVMGSAGGPVVIELQRRGCPVVLLVEATP
jgi:hypothetical protein